MSNQTRSRIGFNALETGINNKPYFVDLTARLRSSWTLVINDDTLAQQTIITGANVIHRLTHMDGRRDEGNVWRDDSAWVAPSRYVESLIRNSRAKNTVKYVLNEPNVAKADEMRALCDWLVEVGALLHAKGYRAVLGNFPPANERLDWAEAGVYDKLIRFIAETAGMYYGGHAYTWGALPLGVGFTSWVDVTPYNVSAMHPGRWASASQINPRTTWHIFRTNWVTNLRAEQLGFKPIPTVITEFGWGKMSDIPQDFYRVMEAHYTATAGQNGLDGAESLKNLYRAIYPQWTHGQAMAEQIKWADNIYPPNVEGILIFAYGSFGDFGQDYAGNTEFHERLVSGFGGGTSLPPPTKPVAPQRWQSARLSPKGTLWVNLRRTADITASIVTRVYRNTSVLIGVDGAIPDRHDKSKVWLSVRIGSRSGYIRQDVVNVNHLP